MSSGDHVSNARDVYDEAAQTYVQFVGTEISSATECPVDQSILVDFIGLIKSQAISRVADVGCGPGRVAAFMADTGFTISTKVLRAPELEHATTSQGFIVATNPLL